MKRTPKHPIDTTQPYGFPAETIHATLSADPIASELAESWINGNREYVLDTLSVCAPHIAVCTALALLAPMTDCGGVNTLANTLIGRFIGARDQYQRDAKNGINPYASRPCPEPVQYDKPDD